MGKNNPNRVYLMHDIDTGHNHTISSMEDERDLGVVIQSDLKWLTQVNSAVSKANMMLGIIKQTFKYFDSNTVKKLFTTFVRPHLELAVNNLTLLKLKKSKEEPLR